MQTELQRPKVRGVEAFPVTVEGQRLMAIRDPSGWSERVLMVTQETLFVISCFDGRRDLRDVQAACMRRFKELVPLDAIRDVARELDNALFLDSPRFAEHRAGIESDFLASERRAPACAGSAYAGEAAALRSELDRMVCDANDIPAIPEGRLRGLIAPHIDLRRGGAGYGAAYRAVAERGRPGLFVILGTAHASPDEPFVATRKAYDTPLGPVETDGDFIDRLACRYGDRIFNDEVTHRREHSIEFQAVLLRHLFPEGPVRIVPILCSSFQTQLQTDTQPREDRQIREFLETLRETLGEHPEACLVAGADLAHLGPRFGDPAPVDDQIAAWCEQRDRESLEAVAAGDSARFFQFIAGERDRRRICGTSAIYTLLEALPEGARATLLHYGQALDKERTTFVSFASMAFTTSRP